MVVEPVSGSPISGLFPGDMDQSSHPLYLNRTAHSTIPVMHYDNGDLPFPLREAIDHIDFQISNKTSSRVLVFFSHNPGFVNISVSRLASDFIVNRPEWVGNLSHESVTTQLFMNWAEDTIKSYRILHNFYPAYIFIFRNNKHSSLNPVYINYWYEKKIKPVIRYNGQDLSDDVSRYVDAIEFQTSNQANAQVMIYMHPDIGIAGCMPSTRIADFVMSRPEWKGDRSRMSVIVEIYLHWLADNLMPLCSRDQILDALYMDYVIGSGDNRTSPVCPIHLGYYYTGLNGTPIMDPILKRI
ncbi:MAG: hypothetical protein CVV33_01235 [Methanomicrobiales archaeon HGW-Methanomicrobiales-4]|nr:MAG: hypothetical protein CVV33_01235 [Methanomicrobiales archaeon HGW-Methanomicrobiales-4]